MIEKSPLSIDLGAIYATLDLSATSEKQHYLYLRTAYQALAAFEPAGVFVFVILVLRGGSDSGDRSELEGRQGNRMQDWMMWFLWAGGLVIAELLTGTFYLLMISIGLAAGG